MTNKEFVEKLREVESKYITHYATGTFGQCATDTVINAKKNQYPKQYTKNVVDTLLLLPDSARLFDCCGLIKGVVWGFPNMVYTSNGCPDVNDQGLYDMCEDKSKDFSNIIPGELLWLKGHVGVYLGDGIAIECTNKWTSNVLYSSVSNISTGGENPRKWTAHGKLPFINYEEAIKEKPVPAKKSSMAIVDTKSQPLYVREKPMGKIISSFLKGAKVEIIDDSKEWWRVKGKDYRGTMVEGVCYSGYLRRV